MEQLLRLHLQTHNMDGIVSFCEKYPFYISSHLYPLLQEQKRRLPHTFVNQIVEHIRLYYSHERLFAQCHERDIRKIALLTIHNRYHV